MTGRAIAVLGTASDVGKSTIVAGLCRLFADEGLTVAPFKAQNMALNSFVTSDHGEIGRAQAFQAYAARTTPEVAMNPVLLKPTGERTSQVVVLGRVWKTMQTNEYYASKGSLRETIEDALTGLRKSFDVVVIEGAGSTAEINLLDRDNGNVTLAQRMGLPAILVGDIERGGVFASLYGTIALLPEHYAATIGGFVINKFRGDPSLLTPGVRQLETLTRRPCLGVLPYRRGMTLDAEDSLGLGVAHIGTPGGVDVAIVALPMISNFTDFDPLRFEEDLTVRFVRHPGELGAPDLVILPGTKATTSDLAWLRQSGLADAIGRHRSAGGFVLGVCGGYQMLGERIIDPVEGSSSEVAGLSWLPVHTIFEPDKVVRQVRGQAFGVEVAGYQIHHGRVRSHDDAEEWLSVLVGGTMTPEGATDANRRVYGTTLHGIFESDDFRVAFFSRLAQARGRRFESSEVTYENQRERYIDELADTLRENLDMKTLWHLIEGTVCP
ncbi:MAG: cobyric acid synthase [Acidimicrobiales bacterium]